MPNVQGAKINYEESEDHILRRIASAVIYQWDEIPEDVQNLIVNQAPFMLDRYQTVPLSQQIKAFIEKHKGGD